MGVFIILFAFLDSSSRFRGGLGPGWQKRLVRRPVESLQSVLRDEVLETIHLIVVL